jgi:hypothetical protein
MGSSEGFNRGERRDRGEEEERRTEEPVIV